MQKVNLRSTRIERLAKNKNVGAQFRVKENSYPIHTHDYFEIEFIVSGEGEHFVNDKSYPLKRGSIMFLTPADCHSIKFYNKVSLWNISFNEQMFSEEFLNRAYSNENYKNFFEEEEFQKLELCATLIKKEIETGGCVKPLLEYVLSLILPKGVDDIEKPLSKVIDYVKIYFRDSPTVAEAAKVACLSPVYFGNVFKKTYGVSFNTYVSRKKVECAKILLANGMNVTEACFESGFNSLSSFLKVFRKETGFTPKENQKKNY